MLSLELSFQQGPDVMSQISGCRKKYGEGFREASFMATTVF